MSARTWVYSRLTGFTPLTDLIGEDDPRVFAKKTLPSAVEDHPYIVYKMGYSEDQGFSEELEMGTQFVQIWIHDYSDDGAADYMQIDDVIQQVRNAFFQGQSPDDNVIFAKYIETSQDLNDETLDTVFRYVRFQLMKEGN